MEKDIWLFIEKTLEQPLTSGFTHHNRLVTATICLWCKYVWCLMFHIATPDWNLKPGPHRKRKTDVFESLTRCYRPSPCCKVSIQLQSPLFDSGDRLWCSARLAVLREASILISSTWSRIFGVNTVKTLRSPHLSRRQLVPQHISQRQASIPPSPREQIWCECECIKEKVCRWQFFFLLKRRANTSG